jgi:hypothetical protein
MRWNIILEWVGEDGEQSAITLGTIERFAGSTTAENLGSQSAGIEADSKPFAGHRSKTTAAGAL